MFYLKVIRQIVLRGPLQLSIKERKQLMKWKAGSLTNQKLLHSDVLNTHGMASVSVALLVETNMTVYKSRAKQLRRQTTSITMHIKKHQVVFPYDPGE